MNACNCMGPRPGEPLCPCQMRGVEIINGRYVRPSQDLGPVVTQPVDNNIGGRAPFSIPRWEMFETCDLAPAPWACGRIKGHDGPCAAYMTDATP